jgi:diguanylate cyclase (GGDEF)-like protein
VRFLSPTRSGSDKATERATRPLARRFTYRYTLALTGFVVLAVVTMTSFNQTLDRAEEASVQLDAVGAQALRLQELASLAQGLTDAETQPSEAGDDAAEIARMRTEYVDDLSRFRDAHIGLTEGKGTTGLSAPNRRLTVWWQSTGGSRVEEIDNFYDQANTLTGFLGSTGGNTEGVENLNTYLQAAADPLDGTVATVYEEAITEYTANLADEIDDQRATNQLLVALTGAMVLIAVFVLFRPMAQRLQLETTALLEAERVQRENNERQLFRNQLVLGLERASSEEEIYGRVEAAMREALPDRPAELLIADTTGAHLRQVQFHPEAGSPECPVDDPSDCVAIARGQTVRFETSRALDVCPKLPQHAAAPCSAICSPVRFLGQPLGVVHVIGPDLTMADHQLVERVNVIANETGTRLGTLRTTRESKLQATTDGLTGLPNRRNLEAVADELMSAGRSFAVAIADLDHFKDLNDTFGHEAGDRALRLFARTLRSNLRPDDIAARYGGEEFVLLLPNTSIEEARRALDRLRVTLAGDIAASGSSPFTASWGLTTSDATATWSEMIHAADEALYAAKRAGRNRVVVATGGSPMMPMPTTDTIRLDDDGTATLDGSQPCGGCDFENPPSTRYCLRCGTNLEGSAAASAEGQDSEDEGGEGRRA